MLQQLVGFLAGGLPVVARDRHRHIARQQFALEDVDLLQHSVGHDHRIGPLALRH
jgi:hypothetical protein